MADRARPSWPRPVRGPAVLQMEALECGPAALAIILAHHGRHVLLEELRLACGVSRDGSRASNLVRAARGYGLEARGFRYEVAQVHALPPPFIVFWNFNHFLVVEGFDRRGALLNDPAEGPRRVTHEAFDRAYTGITLTFKPGPSFQTGGARRGLAAALAPRLRGSGRAMAFALLAGLAMVVPGLLIPAFGQIFVDRVLLAHLDSWLLPLLAGMALTAALRAVLVYLQQRVLDRLTTRLSVVTTTAFLWHVLRLPVQYFTQRFSGEISSRLKLNLAVAEFLSAKLATRAIDAVLVGFFALAMATYSVAMTLVGLAAVALMALVTALSRGRIADGNRRLLMEEGKAEGVLMDGLAAIESLKASACESGLFARWAGYHANYVNARMEVNRVNHTAMVVQPFLEALARAVLLAMGAHLILRGRLTVGQLVAFQSLMASFLGPVRGLMGLSGELQEMEGTMDRLDDVLKAGLDPQTLAPEGDAPFQRLDGTLELRAVTFGYSRLDPPLLEGLQLTLAPGERAALVGPSGCGKSTVTRLLAGLYEPWSGQVLLDGQPRSAWPRSVLSQSVAIVDQEIVLFEGTIRDNLSLWDPTVPEAVLVQACQDACIHDDIAARKGGYDSRVAEGGGNFSGGQRQRLEIARALVRGPRLLVLDEATSALDAHTESLIDQNLKRRGCTCVIVAHRLSTVRDADVILVMDQGRVLQRGTHAALIQNPGPYARLAWGM